jgi:predicted transcriptional regulator
MKSNLITVAMEISTPLYKKLSKLAEIADRSPEWLAGNLIEHCIAQPFDERDLDTVLPFIPYDTYEEADRAAKAGMVFENRKCSNFFAQQEDDGKFYIAANWERPNIIQFPAFFEGEQTGGENRPAS